MFKTRLFIRQTYGFFYFNLKSRYRNTFAGFLWVIVNPIIIFLTQAIIFQMVLRIEIKQYPLFLLCSLLPWVFLTTNLRMGIPHLSSSSDLIKSFKINPCSMTLATTMDNFLNFLCGFALLLLPSTIYYSSFSWRFILLPIFLINLASFAFFLSTSLSILHVIYRDISYFTDFLLSLLYFATPIFYPIDFLSQPWRDIISYNPFYMLLKPFRWCLFENLNESLTEQYICFAPTLLSILFFVLVWKVKRNEFLLRL